MNDKLIRDMNKLLTEKQIANLAQGIGLSYAHLKAIIEVETSGKGFYTVNGLFPTLIPIVRFENHKFSEFTNRQYDLSHPYLSTREFTNQYNRVGIQEYQRFEQAYKLDGKAAVYATSWGMGQIMGFNHEMIGYPNLFDFLNDAFTSEASQVRMICQFLKYSNKNMIDYMRTENWDKVAEVYNGKGYKQNNYHTKLRQSFQKHKSTKP